jgi:agarase
VEYLGREDTAPGRRRLLETLEEWYLNVGELNRAWGTNYGSFRDVGRTPQVGSCIPEADVNGFLEVIAEQYFRVAHEAIRAVDERHMMLGCHLAWPPPRPVLRAMVDYVDAISLSHSGDAPPADDLRAIHRITGKPTIVTPLGGPGRRPEWPDPDDADHRAGAERESAAWYESYVLDLVALPMVVGFHWPDYADRPAEDVSSMASGVLGLVDARGIPHPELVKTVEGVNHSVYRRASEMGTQAAP